MEIPPGEEDRLLLGAANRDPDAYPEPDCFDVGRFAPGSGAPPTVALA